MKGRILQLKYNLERERKTPKEKHVFPGLVFIMHLIFFCKSKQCLLFFFFQFQSVMNVLLVLLKRHLIKTLRWRKEKETLNYHKKEANYSSFISMVYVNVSFITLIATNVFKCNV